jgi:hypothetical protein
MNDLSGRAAVFSQQQNQNLINQLNQYAGWQQNAWDYNVNQPYQMKLAEGQALAGAGIQNTYEALKGGAGAMANIFGQKALSQTGGAATGFQSPERSMTFNQLPANPFATNNMMLDAPATNFKNVLTPEDAALLARLGSIAQSKGSGIATVYPR